MRLHGSVLVLFLFDVCDEIRLDVLRQLLGAGTSGGREPSFKHSTPEHVRFERPPVIQPVEPFSLADGRSAGARLKYYEYGVVSVEFLVPFETSWAALIELSSRWIAGADLERHAAKLLNRELGRVHAAIVNGYPQALREDYFVFQLDPVPEIREARSLLHLCHEQIAMLVSGESTALAAHEAQEITRSSMSYYPADLAVIGWNAALLYDSAAGAEASIQLLEYANTQLLEFRHYDEVLTRELKHVYRGLNRGSGLLDSWRLGRAAAQLNTLLIDVTELAERADTSIKFVSDIFSARFYRLAAARVGVPDYRNLVERKLSTARELYRFMMDRFHNSRAFVLEILVVIILIIELVFLFRPAAA